MYHKSAIESGGGCFIWVIVENIIWELEEAPSNKKWTEALSALRTHPGASWSNILTFTHSLCFSFITQEPV